MQEGKLRANRRTPAPAEDASSWDLAKWLVPSVSALCVLIGYVAKFGHHAFLGIDPGLLTPDEYLATTGEFFRWLLHLPFSGTKAWMEAMSGWSHVLSVWPAIVGVAVLWHYRRRASRQLDSSRVLLIVTWLLVAVVLMRWVAMDAPISQLESALVSDDASAPSETAKRSLGDHLRPDPARSNAIHRAFMARAAVLWSAKRCVRPLPQNSPTEVPPCTPETYAGVEDGEGLAQLIVNLVIATLAGRILSDRPRRWQARIAWIAVFSCFTLAITFGKLGHSMAYDVALVGVKVPLNFIEPAAPRESAPDEASPALAASSTAPGTTASTKTAAKPPAAGASTSSKYIPDAEVEKLKVARLHVLQGVVLQTDKDWTTMVVSNPDPGPSNVQIWRIANSNILWERDIFRTDVLSWSASRSVSADSAATDAATRPLYPH